jgi:hypothetical protein
MDIKFSVRGYKSSEGSLEFPAPPREEEEIEKAE